MISRPTSFLFCVIVAVLLAACSAPQPTAESPTPTPEGGYPVPQVVTDVPSNYPAPGESEGLEIYATPGPIPTPDADTAVVTGRLLVEGKPVVNVYIALAEIIVDEQGQERVVSYDQFNSPKGLTNEDGTFVLANIQPGRYGLILDAVISSALLNEPDEAAAYIITAESGETLDLGDLDYDESLPVPADQILR